MTRTGVTAQASHESTGFRENGSRSLRKTKLRVCDAASRNASVFNLPARRHSWRFDCARA
ncbi:hypothetical protein X777_02493 [Ooceraea biroi]|uniref:Uncharacterized protein n=1 Tax=Ooceraea biroi TaxID=2015173 RepID=A0A026WME7_OOCBI|nr:hypothetical protein X777_02493 [Ooceraea biroi]